ncbi:MAG: DUF190 domain-containing protein [Bryobacterales bacterium]|nr:DUF190 domain-containing protein [Bryobacterales bacterium]
MPIGEPAKLLRIHIGERDLFDGKPLYEAIVAKCQEAGIAGATVIPGIEGYGDCPPGGGHPLHEERPVLISIVDTAENLTLLIPEVEQMIGKGLIAMSDVKVIRVEKGRRE